MSRLRAWLSAARRSPHPRRRAIARDILKLRLSPSLPRPLRFAGLTIDYEDEGLLRELLWEIFVEQRYELGDLPERPRIFDVGANIGIATLFFASRAPGAEIHAYEPDPATFALLERNVRENGLTGVTLHNCALSDEAGEQLLHVRSAVAGGDIGASLDAGYRRCFHAEGAISSRPVQVRKLSDELRERGPADVLKLDIEGAEAGVFRDLGGDLSRVARLAMEYHYLPEHRNPLSRILAPLEAGGYHTVLDGPPRELGAPAYELFLKAWSPAVSAPAA